MRFTWLHFHFKIIDFVQFEVLEIAFEVQLRLPFHLFFLYDFVQFEVFEIAFEVKLKLLFHLF